MALSPFDVEHKTFRTALRGYAEEEVDEFLDEIVASLREHEQRLREATEQVTVLESELAASREAEAAIRRTFIAAQRTADQMIEEAQIEAKKIIADAKDEAAENQADRERAREEAQAEITGIRASIDDLKGRLRAIAEGVFSDVEGIEASVEQTAATYDLDRDFDVPALLAEDDSEDIEYYDEAESGSPEEEVEAAEAEEEMAGEEFDLDDVVVDLDEAEPATQRSRPRRPWERDASSDD